MTTYSFEKVEAVYQEKTQRLVDRLVAHAEGGALASAEALLASSTFLMVGEELVYVDAVVTALREKKYTVNTEFFDREGTREVHITLSGWKSPLRNEKALKL